MKADGVVSVVKEGDGEARRWRIGGVVMWECNGWSALL